jgi:hypothetical protein
MDEALLLHSPKLREELKPVFHKCTQLLRF